MNTATRQITIVIRRRIKKQIKSRFGDSEEPSSAILHSAIRSLPVDWAGQQPKDNEKLKYTILTTGGLIIGN